MGLGLTARVIPTVALNWRLQNWYDPGKCRPPVKRCCEALLRRFISQDDFGSDWIPSWLQCAQEMIDLNGHQSDEYAHQLKLPKCFHDWMKQVYATAWRNHPLYNELYRDRPLTSLQGIGEASAAIYRGFIMDIAVCRMAMPSHNGQAWFRKAVKVEMPQQKHVADQEWS